MNEPLPQPWTDFVNRRVDALSRDGSGWEYNALVIGVDLPTGSLIIKTYSGEILVPATTANFIFHEQTETIDIGAALITDDTGTDINT